MSKQIIEPLILPSQRLSEFTFRTIVLSIILAALLAASNIYLALKIGNTIAASIPASVMALGVLRFFKNSNVLECNMAQTAASAGEGVAAAIAYFLPAMLLLKVWTGFPYLPTLTVTILGGVLGALFSIPLRRVLLNLPTLRFPEGVAIGSVLKASLLKGKEAALSLKFLISGGVVGGLITFCQTGLQIAASNLQLWTRLDNTICGFSFGFTPATIAAGYIIGVETSIVFLLGLVIGWLILLPLLGHFYGVPAGLTPYSIAMDLWSKHLRFIGVGTMLVGGVYTLLSLFKAVVKGVQLSFASLKKVTPENIQKTLRTEQDIPFKWTILGIVFISIILALVLYRYFATLNLGYSSTFLMLVVAISIIFTLIYGFVVATISSYFCGLVGSTNNPISGIMISAILSLSILFLFIFKLHLSTNAKHIAAAVIFISTILAGVGSIAGENIQDLKAGQIVGATPWKQQLMIIIGVVASAVVVSPILELLFNAYGIAGVYPHPGMDASQMLAAPQSALMASVTSGVLAHQLNWSMMITGICLGILLIFADEIAKRKNMRIPPLAVGLGIYLPPEVMTPIILGGFISYFVKKRKTEQQTVEKQEQIATFHQRGILLACGVVAGSALMGVILAIPFVLMGSADALSIAPKWFTPFASLIGLLSVIILCVWLYRTGRGKFFLRG